MTLCGVLKNILLVCASVLIWGTVVTSLQVLGYALALAGLVYYGVGYEGIKVYYSATQDRGQKLWEGSGAFPYPAASSAVLISRVLVIGLYGFVTLLVVISLVTCQEEVGKGLYDLAHWLAFPES